MFFAIWVKVWNALIPVTAHGWSVPTTSTTPTEPWVSDLESMGHDGDVHGWYLNLFKYIYLIITNTWLILTLLIINIIENRCYIHDIMTLIFNIYIYILVFLGKVGVFGTWFIWWIWSEPWESQQSSRVLKRDDLSRSILDLYADDIHQSP